MAVHELREASDLRTSALTIGLVLVAGLLLRFWALDSGLPYSVGPNEPVVMNAVVQAIRTGDVTPHRVDGGGEVFYAHVMTGSLRFLAGAREGRWSAVNEAEPRDFYLWSRRLTALLGGLTVLLVYVIGLRWGARHALLAAGLLAVMPQHVGASHFVNLDVPLTFFVTLTLWLSLRAHDRARLPGFVWAGLVAGLAASVRHTGGLALLLPLVTAWMTLPARPSRLRCALAATLAGLAGLVLGAPDSLLDLPRFLDGLAARLIAPPATMPVSEPGWLMALGQLSDGMGWPAVILAGGGLALGLVRAAKGPGRVRWTLGILFPLIFLTALAPQSAGDGTWLLPLLPFTCLLAASAVVSGVSLLRRFDISRAPRTALIAGLTVTSLLIPSIRAIQLDRRLGVRTTVALAYDWIVQAIPAGAAVAVDRNGPWLPPGRYDVLLAGGPAAAHPGHATDDEPGYVVRVVAPGAWTSPGRTKPDGVTELARFQPSPDHPGPELRIYRTERGVASSMSR